MAEFDDRSEKNLATLRPKAQPYFRALLRALKEYAGRNGLDARIISGHRTWAEQDALYAQGRTRPGPRVTNARGGQSNHNFQIAVDIGLFDNGKYLPESPHYKKMGPLGEAAGLEWGGRWTSPVDTPHYQIKTGRRVSALRDLVAGKGWDAIDALIPDYVPPAARPRAAFEETPDKAAVLLAHGEQSKPLDLDAWYLEGQVWVAVRDWVDYFGGALVEQSGEIALVLSGERETIATEWMEDRPMARFAEVNAMLGWSYSFDGLSRPRTLTVHMETQGPGEPG